MDAGIKHLRGHIYLVTSAYQVSLLQSTWFAYWSVADSGRLSQSNFKNNPTSASAKDWCMSPHGIVRSWTQVHQIWRTGVHWPDTQRCQIS